MATASKILVPTVKPSFLQPCRPTISLASRHLASGVLVHSRQSSIAKGQRKKMIDKVFGRHDLEKRGFPRFSLIEAMRILRAFEVGKPPASVKYDLALNLKTERHGAVLKNTTRLPHPVTSDWRIAVICKEDSNVAAAASAAGAVCVGEESLFADILDGKIAFDCLLCHVGSQDALIKARLGPILGPRGLMPSERMKTIVQDPAKSIRESASAVEYRERLGVIRLPIGQLGYTPLQLKENIQSFMGKIKIECALISEKTPKSVHEVILSSTNGPGLSLSGKLIHDDDKFTAEHLSGAM